MKIAFENGIWELALHLHDYRHFQGKSKKDSMDAAAANGDFDLVEWFHFNCAVGFSFIAMDQAATNGDSELVEWLHANRKEGCSYQAMIMLPRMVI